MSKRLVIGAVAVLLLAGGVFVSKLPAVHPAPQNLLLISIDTLRADHLGLYGYTRDTSPILDRLGRNGITFTRAVSQAPNTPPSQMSLLTSLYYSVHGFTGNDDRLPEWRVTLAEMLRDQGFATWGFVDGGYLRASFGFGQGFDHFEDQRRGIAQIVQRVQRWLDRPLPPRFFLFVHCYDVHSPYAPPPPFNSLFEETPYRGHFIPTNKTLRQVAHEGMPLTDDDLRHVVALYDGEIRNTDGQIGRLLDTLARRGVLDSTLVVVVSDHGEEFKEHGSMLHWQTWFAPNLHVPMIFSMPGASARRIDTPVELIDVVPTVLDLLGLPAHPQAMGRSLVPLMEGRDEPAMRTAYGEPYDLRVPTRTIVSDRYELHYDVRTGRSQLFDQRTDPWGLHDIAGGKPDMVASLLQAYQERQRAIAVARAQAGGPPTERAPMDDQTQKQLRALGYLK